MEVSMKVIIMKKQKIYYSRRGICLAQTITQEEECLHFAPAKDDKYYHVCKHREDNGKCRGEEAFLRCLLGEEDIEQVNDLKCCGNCKHYTSRGDCRSKHGYSPGHYCDFWYTDGLTRKDRE